MTLLKTLEDVKQEIKLVKYMKRSILKDRTFSKIKLIILNTLRKFSKFNLILTASTL